MELSTTISLQSNSLPSPDDDLEAFAQHFKERRMKLALTQSEVGKAIGAMQFPGGKSFQQSTICQFENYKLPRASMLALRPLLEEWLRREEQKPVSGERMKTRLTDRERRNLERFCKENVQPSSKRIAEIALDIGLAKSMVRTWSTN